MLKEKDLVKIQNKLGYQFENKRLLIHAFTQKSFSAINGGEDNEVLEFYGDRILDLAVVKDFYDLNGRFNKEGEFISSKIGNELCKEDICLVKNAHLAERIFCLGFSKYLQVERFSERSNMKVKADLFEAIMGAVALDSNWNLQTISTVLHAMMCSRETNREKVFRPAEYLDFFETELWKLGISKPELTYKSSGPDFGCQSQLQKSVTFATGLQESQRCYAPLAILEVNFDQFQKSVWTFETASPFYFDD